LSGRTSDSASPFVAVVDICSTLFCLRLGSFPGRHPPVLQPSPSEEPRRPAELAEGKLSSNSSQIPVGLFCSRHRQNGRGDRPTRLRANCRQTLRRYPLALFCSRHHRNDPRDGVAESVFVRACNKSGRSSSGTQASDGGASADDPTSHQYGRHGANENCIEVRGFLPGSSVPDIPSVDAALIGSE
jgi:hypothetical protein